MTMSTVAPALPLIAPHRFAYGFHRQTWWNWRIGAAFFLGEIGAGLFLISLATGHLAALVLGYLIVIAGKNTAHLLYLGKPARFWRAAMRPDRSWIARGIWATGLFAIAGAVVIAARGHWIAIPRWSASLAEFIGICAALFIMFYDGLVMKASAGIRFWKSFLLPLLCLTYALLGGTTLALTVGEFRHVPVPASLASLEHVLLMLNCLLLITYVVRMSQSEPAAREAVHLLTDGAYRRTFLGLVILVGIVATFFFSILHLQFHTEWLVLLIAFCELIGDFALVMVLLKTGLCSPQAAPKYLAVPRPQPR